MKHGLNAAERVRYRVRQWLKDAGHGARKRLAESIPATYGETKSKSWVTDITRESHDGTKRHDIRLRDLDAIAAAMGVPVGELVQSESTHYIEATPTELRLIRYYRSLPHEGKTHWMAHLDSLFSAHERELEAQATERDQRTAAARSKRRIG